jgi:hypothetical protein
MQVHTNPVLISFCSILYYRDLAEHIKCYNREKRRLLASQSDTKKYYFMKKFGNKLDRQRLILDDDEQKSSITNSSTKKYNKTIVNRWHLLLRLDSNKELIQFRKHQIKKHKKHGNNDGETPQLSILVARKVKSICSKKQHSNRVRAESKLSKPNHAHVETSSV